MVARTEISLERYVVGIVVAGVRPDGPDEYRKRRASTGLTMEWSGLKLKMSTYVLEDTGTVRNVGLLHKSIQSHSIPPSI